MMELLQNQRETRKCVGCVISLAVSQAEPNGRRRKRPRCGVAALDFGDVRIAGKLVEIPLCRTHFRVLRDSADPIALAQEWAVA
jgi:hypothetical protein